MEKPVDLRIQKTYHLLHKAFTGLMEDKGFEAITVGQLCEHAMIRRATFYKHFADKYEYFSFYMKEIFATFHAGLQRDAEVTDVNAYALHMVRELLKFVKKHDKFVSKAMEASVSPTTLTILLELLGSDFQQVLRSARPELSEAQVAGQAAFFTGGVLSTLFGYLQKGQPIDEEEFLAIVSAFLFRE